ncbi:MAG: tetratricopeptide repeat protein [Chloroflexota bacterium]
MGFFDKLFGGGTATSTQSPTAMDQMREAMDMARYARRAESYDQAYAALEKAMQIADTQKDTHSITVIALHQADILIDQRRYDDAEKLLQTVQQTAESVNQRGFTAYALTSLGNLHWHRGEQTAARETYEQAREIAANAGALGPEARAMGHLADVYLHDNNASYAIHLLEETLPKLNTANDLEMSSYFVGRLGEAMLANGQPTDGRLMLERALRLGEQMRDVRMTRRWTLALADTHYDQENYEDAFVFYKQALETLGESTPIAERVRIITRMSRISLNIGERDAALQLAEQAKQLLDGPASPSSEITDGNKDETSAVATSPAPIGEVDPALNAEVESALGMALRALNRNVEAVPHLEAAVANASGTVDALYISSLRYLATAQLDADQPDTARATYERALQLATDADLRLPLAYTHRDFGLLHNKTGDMRAAIEQWTKALEIFQDEHESNQAARVLCDLANTRRGLGQTKRAMTDYENALVALNHVDDIATRGLVLANAANAYTDQGDTESSAAFFQESIDIARQISDRTAESTRLGNYAWFLLTTGEPRKAVERLTEALEISKADGLTLHTAIQTDNLGLAYDALTQYKTALNYHEEGLTTLDGLTPVPQRWRALVKSNIAKTKVALGFVDDAAEVADEALKIARSSADFEVIVIALLAVGRVRLRQSQPVEAETPINEALSITKRASLRRLQAEAYHLYSEQKAASGDQETAREYWENAKRFYRMVAAPQAKLTPFWLGNNAPTEDTAT